MVFHYARAGTIDHSVRERGFTINDWMEIPAG